MISHLPSFALKMQMGRKNEKLNEKDSLEKDIVEEMEEREPFSNIKKSKPREPRISTENFFLFQL